MYDDTDNTDNTDNSETVADKIANHILDHSEVYAVGAVALVVGVGVGAVLGTSLGAALTSDAAANVLRLLVACA